MYVPKRAIRSAARLYGGKDVGLLSGDRIDHDIPDQLTDAIPAARMTGMQERSTRSATTEGRGI